MMALPIKTGSLNLFDGGLECVTVSFRQAVTVACEIILDNLAACRTLLPGLPCRFRSGDLVVYQPCIVFCNLFRCAPVRQIVAFVFVNAFRPSHVKAVTIPTVKGFGNVAVFVFINSGSVSRVSFCCFVCVMPSFIGAKKIVTILYGLKITFDQRHTFWIVVFENVVIHKVGMALLPSRPNSFLSIGTLFQRPGLVSPTLNQPDIIPVRESFIVFATFPSLFQGRQSLNFGPEPNSPIIVKKPVRTIRSRSLVKRQGTRICCSSSQNQEGQNG